MSDTDVTHPIDDDDLSVRDRLAQAVTAGQEPKDRLWAAIFVMMGLILVLGVGVLASHNSQRAYLTEGRAIGFERGAVDCLTLVVDNDRDFNLPPYCKRGEVIVHFPPEVCDRYYKNSDRCGTAREGDGG